MDRRMQKGLLGAFVIGAPLTLAVGYLVDKPVVRDVAPAIRFDNSRAEDYEVENSVESGELFEKDSDGTLLARMIFGEARNCSKMEQIAIGFTALNRANDGKKWNGETLREAILLPKQYSCFNSNDPNFVKVMNPEKYEPEAFRECLDVAKNILSGKLTDSIRATHYYNPDNANPSWTKKLEKIGRIESERGESKHVFYRER